MDMTKQRMRSHETKGKVLILADKVFKNYNDKDMDIIKFFAKLQIISILKIKQKASL